MPLTEEMKAGLDIIAVDGHEGVYLGYGASDRCAYVYRDDAEDPTGVALVGIWYLDPDGQPVDNRVHGSEPWTQQLAVQELTRQQGPTGLREQSP